MPRTPNTFCYSCKQPLYKSPGLFKIRDRFSCSSCSRLVISKRMKENPKSYEAMVKIAKSKKGIVYKPEQFICPKCSGKKSKSGKMCKKCSAKLFSGKNSPTWKGGLTSRNVLDRTKFAREVRKTVFERDNYTCQLCNKRGGKLQVDHIKPFSDYIELRFNIDNCRTLCMACHYKITYKKELPNNIDAWGFNYSHVLKGIQ